MVINKIIICSITSTRIVESEYPEKLSNTEILPNKNLQADNLRGDCFVVQLSPHFTTKQSPHKLRLKLALGKIFERNSIS